MGRPAGAGKTAWPAVIVVNTAILIVLLACAIGYSGTVWGLPQESMILLLSVAVVAVFVWSVWSWRALTGSLFDPYVLFLVAAVLFNAGHAILELFGANRGGILGGDLSADTILRTLFLVALGLMAFNTGGLLGVPVYRRGLAGAGVTETDAARTRYALRLVGWTLLAVSLVPALLVMKDAIALSMSSGYFATMTTEVPTGFDAASRKLADFLMPATIFLLAGSRGLRLELALSASLVLTYSFAQFFIGSRHGAVMLLIAYAWVFHRCVRPLPKTLLLGAGGFMLLVVFPLVRASRDTVLGGSRLSPGAWLETFSTIDSPVVAVISEMGNSMQTVAYTLSYIPDSRGFDAGASYLYSLFGLVPNLFWEVHPTHERGLLSAWLVQTIEPGFVGPTGYFTLGFSFIAEAYLNFGWYGAPIALGLMGLLLAKFVLWAQRSADPAKIAAVGAFTAFFLIFARAESNEVVRYLVWYALIPYLGVLGLKPFIRPRPRTPDRGLQSREAPVALQPPVRDGGS